MVLITNTTLLRGVVYVRFLAPSSRVSATAYTQTDPPLLIQQGKGDPDGIHHNETIPTGLGQSPSYH